MVLEYIARIENKHGGGIFCNVDENIPFKM